jgi:subtilase family serine protease
MAETQLLDRGKEDHATEKSNRTRKGYLGSGKQDDHSEEKKVKTGRNGRLLTRSFRGLATLLLIVPALLAGNGLARAGGPNGNGASNLIPNNTPGFIRKAVDLGAVDPSTQISVTIWLQLHNENKLDQTVRDLNRKGSSQYHQWLSQSQFNAAYSPTSQEVNAVENFLSAHKLSVLNVAENNFYIETQGAVGDIQRAFHVQIDNYNLNGTLYRSNTADPSVNGGPNGLIAAITGMDDYGYSPTVVRPTQPDGTPYAPVPLVAQPTPGSHFESQCFRGTESHTFTTTITPATTITATATYTGNRYGADITNTGPNDFPPCGYQPSEVQTAYNMGPLSANGLTGAGQTVVIVDAFGSATIAQDANAFSNIYGLPALTPGNFQIYQAPGSTNSPHGTNWDVETTLDVEWVHGMAPDANIALVIAPNNRSDLDEAINWAVIHHLGNTISNSWAGLEGFGNPRQLDRVNRILEQAAAEGIDVNFSSGDDGDEAARAGFQTVDFPASSPFATGVGGTSLALNPDNSMAFQTGWGTNLTTLADPGNVAKNPPTPLGFQFGAGGGPSLTFARPDFQSGLSVPGNTRLVPDISMLADPQTGAEIIETVGGQLTVSTIGGTSLACPIFSALMAIAAQKAGHGLGQAAPLLYNLDSSAITDVPAVSSPNNVTGSITTLSGTTNYSADQLATPGAGVINYYSAFYNSPFSTRWFVITFGTDTSLTTGPGWDDVTGLGTPNGAAFVNALVP